MEDKREDIILSIRGMSKSFGRNRVLDHINLDVKKGTVMGLMGENGAYQSLIRYSDDWLVNTVIMLSKKSVPFIIFFVSFTIPPI